jgi:predicted ABC-type ATPase
MVAGPNGSGKSTLTDALRASGASLPALYINADEIARAEGLDAATAQRAAAQRREHAIAERRDLMYETVMSHPSKVAELQRARYAGYEITVHFVAIEDPDINVQRVALRVADGGHDVPIDKIRERHARTLDLAPAALIYADKALVFDNSRRGALGGLELQATLEQRRLQVVSASPAPWVTRLMIEVNARIGHTDEVRYQADRERCQRSFADLSDGDIVGVIRDTKEARVARFQVQQAPNGTLVMHDMAVLPTRMQPGRTYRVIYRDGVASATEVQPAS